MPQTILAVLALMMATLFAHQQQRSYVRTQVNMVRNELALQGTGVAESVLSEIGSMEFDDATKDNNKVGSPGDLTPPNELGSEGGQADDIDDFHGQVLQEERAFRGDFLKFEVKVQVVYVDEDDMETERTSQTKAKKATVTVRSMDISNPVEIRVSRSYTCGSTCDW